MWYYNRSDAISIHSEHSPRTWGSVTPLRLPICEGCSDRPQNSRVLFPTIRVVTTFKRREKERCERSNNVKYGPYSHLEQKKNKKGILCVKQYFFFFSCGKICIILEFADKHKLNRGPLVEKQ